MSKFSHPCKTMSCIHPYMPYRQRRWFTFYITQQVLLLIHVFISVNVCKTKSQGRLLNQHMNHLHIPWILSCTFLPAQNMSKTIVFKTWISTSVTYNDGMGLPILSTYYIVQWIEYYIWWWKINDSYCFSTCVYPLEYRCMKRHRNLWFCQNVSFWWQEGSLNC